MTHETTLGDLLQQHASKHYRTAQAVIGCAKFPVGAFVSVRYTHHGANGVAWYEIDRTEAGPLDSPVSYPAHHLTAFTL